MDWQTDLLGLTAGVVVAVITAPIGVSGAVFLLPFQLSVLGVPNPQVTPTNLLYNVVSAPGALLRFRQHAGFEAGLFRLILHGSVPGVVAGSIIRVFVIADPEVFRVAAACVLVPIGLMLLKGRLMRARESLAVRPPVIVALSAVVGTVGGVYGIGGGSLLGPILVATGMTVAAVAPVALASTWVTSLVGVATYALLAQGAEGTIPPDWSLGICIGTGGLIGGWVGAGLQPRMPERGFRLLLGALALGLAALYVGQAVS